MLRTIIYSIVFAFSLSANANDELNVQPNSEYSQTATGGIGLIETPTARFSYDGKFGFGISSEAPYNRLYANMQFFPWMEAVLRYTEGTHKPYNTGSHQTWKDKGLDVKIRLLEENSIRPQLALGLIDLGGTGAYSSEYLVASKRFQNIDLSIGIGWGRLGGVDHSNNIIGWLDEDRKIRGGYKPRGGTLSLDRYFSGEYNSIFGGIEYFTPIDNLSLKLEYDSSDYSGVIGREIVFNEEGDIFALDSRLNYAVNYRLNIGQRDKLDLAIGFVRGNTLYANLAVHSNLNYSGKPKIIMGAEQLRKSTLADYHSLNKDWQKYLTDTIIWEMGNAGFVTHNIIYNDNEIAAEISQARFQKTSQAFDLASRILANNAPENIDLITIINIDQGIETIRSTIDKDSLVKAVNNGALSEELLVFNDISPLSLNAVNEENKYLYPNFYWEIKPHMNNTIQHQEKFFFWQLEALIHTEYSIKKGLYLTTDIGIDIVNNLEDYTYHIPDGQLHHVRQDRRFYLTEGKTGLRRMALDYLVDLHPNIKAKLSAGYLEWMYGGAGGELLYIPDSKRWALGLDAYWVKQREFDQKFSFLDYQTVTGFLNYYQDIPFYDMRLKVSIGKFLAKDIGTMIDISRRFKTGARVGGFVALTDCDSACVGEGSFHKGIYFELPMDLFYTQSSTRNKTGYSWSPLTKDAGAKIDSGGLYYLMTNATDEVDTLRQKSWSVKKIFSGFGVKPHSRKNL